MGRKRQTFSKNFKARVVLEALREESTIQEIAGMEDILDLLQYFLAGIFPRPANTTRSIHIAPQTISLLDHYT